MVFWIGILVAALFAWFAFKIGFFEIWAILFNITVSVYIAIFLRPSIVELVPAAGETLYGYALTITATAIACFAVLQGIACVVFAGQLNVEFPKVLDVLGSGALGFLGGYLVWSFIILVISVAPISENELIKQAGFGGPSVQGCQSYLVWWCDLVNRIAGSEKTGYSSEQAIEDMKKGFQESLSKKTTKVISTTQEPAEQEKEKEKEKEGLELKRREIPTEEIIKQP